MSPNTRVRRLIEHVHATCSGLDARYVIVVQIPGEELSDVASNVPRLEGVALLRGVALSIQQGAPESFEQLGGVV